jgi:hypothetical protein
LANIKESNVKSGTGHTDQNNNSLSLNQDPSSILPEYNQLAFNYILINNYLFDLNKASLHNYAKFKHFDKINVSKATEKESDSTEPTVDVSDESLLNLKRYFSFELNENLFEFKRHLFSLNVNLNDSMRTFQSVAKVDWRDCLITNVQPQKIGQPPNVHISELLIEADAADDKSKADDNQNGKLFV